MTSTKQDLLNYLKSFHTDNDLSKIELFSTTAIANDFHISRSLASQYLNSLYREGKVIKIDTRPVYYFARSTLENDFDILFMETSFVSTEDLKNYLTGQIMSKFSFSNLVGYDGTLGETISQIKAAVSYPSNAGLNYLLYGEEGTGKSLLTKCAYEYLSDNLGRTVSREVCDGLNGNFFDQLIEAVESAKDGIVVIKRANLLYENDKRALTNLLESRRYVKRDGQKGHVTCSFVLLFDGKNINELGMIANAFPIKCCVPSYHDRYFLERERIIFQFFKEEAHLLNREIEVSYALVRFLSNSHFPNNLDGLKNLVREVCARASIESSHRIQAGVNHLPERFVSLASTGLEKRDGSGSNYIDVNGYIQIDASEAIITLFENVLKEFKKEAPLAERIHIAGSLLDKFYDSNIFNNLFRTEFTVPYVAGYTEVLNTVMAPYNYILPEHSSTIIAYFNYVKKIVSNKIGQWYQTREAEVQEIIRQLSQENGELAGVIDQIILETSYKLNVQLDGASILALYLMFLNYNTWNKAKPYISLIICHGNSTALSISNLVNSMIGQPVYYAVDMPMDKAMADIAGYVENYINRFRIKTDVILLVDMGSLEELGKSLKNVDSNIYLFNNVSTPMALTVATRIIANAPIEEIEESCKRNFNSSFWSFSNRKQKDAIIFVSENGKSMAERIKNTFVDSLPKSIDLQYFSCSRLQMQNADYIQTITSQYNVLFVLGTSSFEENEFNFISIENLVQESRIQQITKLLAHYLTEDEVEQFRENLIYNFSLQNVIDNMSVLDAKKVLSYTKDAIGRLQKELRFDFSSDILPGIYIHTCFMVERLVTKESLLVKDEDDEFSILHSDFIQMVKKSFTTLCSQYGVELTLAEIKYLYDYIEGDRRNNE